MDLGLAPAQQLLVATAREFLAVHCPPERVQRLSLDASGFDEETWARMAGLGWPGLLVPARWGGSGGSIVDALLLVEEMGRACLPGPFIQSAVVATTLLREAGTPAQQTRVLPRMALGERIATLALVEETSSFDPGAIALPGEVGGRLSGRKRFVRDAHVAHDLVVATRGNGGVNVFWLPAREPGISLRPMPVMSGEKQFEVTFADVELPAACLVGPPGGGGGVLGRALQRGALGRVAEMVGAAGRILDLVVEHARVRVQSGRPLGAFQAIQHACADMLRDVETSRWLLHRSAWRLEQGGPAAAPAADVALAKAHAGPACLRVARRGHQVLGAIGYCEEHPLHLLHKRIHAASLDFGDAALHLEAVARAIGLAPRA